MNTAYGMEEHEQFMRNDTNFLLHHYVHIGPRGTTHLRVQWIPTPVPSAKPPELVSPSPQYTEGMPDALLPPPPQSLDVTALRAGNIKVTEFFSFSQHIRFSDRSDVSELMTATVSRRN